MTKLKQQAINDLTQLDSIEVAKIYELIQHLKEQKQHTPQTKSYAYLTVREALQNCQGTLSDDIYRDREERL